MNADRSIMLTYDHPQISHVKLTYQLSNFGLCIKFGKSIWGVYDSIPRVQFVVLAEMFLHFKEYPELKELHDGYGWNMDALTLFHEALEIEDHMEQ